MGSSYYHLYHQKKKKKNLALCVFSTLTNVKKNLVRKGNTTLGGKKQLAGF